MAKVLFYVLIFVLFVVPDKHFLSFNLFGLGHFNVFQFVALLLPGTLLFISPKYRPSKSLFFAGIFFLVYLIFISLIKDIIYNGSLTGLFLELRLSLVFICAVLVLMLGDRVNRKLFFNLVLMSVFISYLLSLVGFIFEIPLQSYSVRYEEGAFYTFTNGRLINGNKDLSVLGVYFLFRGSSLRSVLSKRIYYFLITLAVLSISIAVLNFDRTLLALLILEVALLTVFSEFKKLGINLFRLAVLLLIFAFLMSLAYNGNEAVRIQVDRRILSVFFTDDVGVGLSNSVWEDNRDFMFTGAIYTFLEFPVFGSHFGTPLFTFPDGTEAFQTDVTFLNILARFGLIGFFLAGWFFFKWIIALKSSLYSTDLINRFLRDMLIMCIPLFLLYSLNHDAIYRGSVVILLALMSTFLSRNYSLVRKNS